MIKNAREYFKGYHQADRTVALLVALLYALVRQVPLQAAKQE